MKNSITQTAMMLNMKQIQHQLSTASRWRVFGLVFSLMAIALAVLFMYWVSEQDEYAFGLLTQTVPISHNSHDVGVLKSPTQTDYILNGEQAINEYMNDWLFVSGERFGDNEPRILDVEHQARLPLIGFLLTAKPTTWLPTLAEHEYLALVFAVALLLFSAYVFRWMYSAVINGFLLVSFWHAMIFAKWNALLTISDITLSVLSVILLASFLPLVQRHNSFLFVDSVFAALAWIVIAPTLATWFGWSEAMIYGVFILALIFPASIAALTAAYLLSNVFHASVVGTYGLLAFSSLVVMAQMIDRNSARKQLSRLSKRFKSQSHTFAKGRVTLQELLNR